ncbi:hypothetical protein Tco_1319125 [Tanacetum coccineum]
MIWMRTVTRPSGLMMMRGGVLLLARRGSVQIVRARVSCERFPLLTLTMAVLFSCQLFNDQEDVNVQGVGDDDVNEGDGMDVVVDDEVQAIVADKPQRVRKKRKAADGASAERFVISLDSSHDLNANAIDDEVTSVIRSSMPPPSILTAAVATTITAGVTSAPVHGSELSAGSFYVSQDMDPETLWQVYIPKWNVINDFVLDDLNIFLVFSVGTARQERDVEIASLKAQLSLKEAEAAEAIRLSGQVAMVEAVEAARASELNDLKDENAALERNRLRQALESAIGASRLASTRTTCSGLRDEVMGYKLFKEQVEAMQDEQVKESLTWLAAVKTMESRRGLVNVVAYNSFAEADYVVAINALRAMDFTLLAQLESRKDASMADIMDLLCLEGPAAETPEASQLQPSPEQLMIIRGDDAACRLSLKDAMVPLIEPLSVKSLTGEASTSGVPAKLLLLLKSILTQFALDALCEKYYIPNVVHPVLFGRNDRIHSLKNWNDHFFWVDASVFPLDVPWHNDKTLRKVPHPTSVEFNVDVYNYLADNPAPFRKFLEPFLCFVGISRYYDLDENCYPTFWANDDEGGDRVVPLAGVNDQEDVNVHGVGDDDVNEGDGDAAEANQTEQVRKKRKAADGASGSGLPPKKLREFHGTSGIGANTGGKSIFALQGFLEGRIVIYSDSSHDLNANAINDEVTFVIRSSMPPPPVLTATVATTITAAEADIAGPSQPVGIELSAGSFYVSQDMDPETLWQVYIPKWNVINDFVLDDPNIFRSMIDHLAPPGFFSQLRGIDYEQLLAEFSVGTARQVCFSAEIRMRLEHELRGRQRFEGKCAMQANWLKERDVAMVEAVEAAWESELNGLKERNAALERHVAALESAAISKDVELASSNAQVAKVTQDLSSLQLSCDELSIKAASLEFKKDKLVDQVSALETMCSGLRDEVMGYKLFKEQVEAMQDEQVKALGDRVAAIDSDLMEMAIHMDEEFYPRYLTTIAGQRWILSCGLKLVIMKCLQSPEYLATLGGVIGRAIDKGMQDGLAADIDHGKARRGLVDVAAYNSSAEAYYVAAINALRAMESQKDASMADIMDLIRLEGPVAENLEASQLQFSPEQLMVPIHQLEDQVVIGETSLSFSLDVAHTRVQRIRGDAAARRLSLTDAMVPLIEPLSIKSLTGEASTSGVPAIAMTTSLSTTFIQASIVLPTPSTEVPPSLNIVFEQEELDTTP